MACYDIQYNGETAHSHGVSVIARPSIPVPEKRFLEYEVAGRDGKLLEFDGTYNDIQISVEMNFLSPRDEWMSRFRDVQHWLLGDGDGKLFLSDDHGVFFKVKAVALGNVDRVVFRLGRFTATFTCDPYSYLETGLRAYTMAEVLFNPYAVSHPVFRITGEGPCTLTVNENTMTANVGQNLTIDTDRMLAFRQDGTITNTDVTGDYAGLYLLPGQNTISITEEFTLAVEPHWRML